MSFSLKVSSPHSLILLPQIKPSPFAPRISSDHPLVWRNKRQRRKLENKRAAPAPSNAATSTSTSRHQAWQQQTIGLSHDGSRSIRISPPSTLSRKRRKSSGQSGMRSLDSYFSPAKQTKVPTPNLISARSQKQPLSMSTFHRKEPPTSRHASRVTPFHNGLTGDGNEGGEEQDEETISIGVARAQPQAYDSSDAEPDDDDDDDDYAPSRVTRRNRVPSRKVREQPLPRPMARRKRIQSPGESSNSYEQHMQKRIAEGSDTGSELEAQMTRTSLDCLNMDNAEGGFGFASFDDDRKPAAKRPVRSHNHEQAPSKPDDLTLEEIIARSKKKTKGRQRKSGRLMEKDAGAIQLECQEERSKRSTLFDEFETLQMATIGLDTFLQYWRMTEVEMGVETEVVEKAKFFTKANQSVQNSTDQKKAQYGRFLPFATHKMFGMVNLNKDDIFIDIGSGIGNTCLQASYTVGCDSRGIELVKDRHAIADIYRKNLNTLNGGEVGKVELVLGELQAEENRDFITGGGRRTVKAFCNNYNAVFSHRSTKTTQQLYTLDHYIAGLFSIMAEGSVLLTLHPLDIGPGSRARVNEERKKRGLPHDHNASFFEETRV